MKQIVQNLLRPWENPKHEARSIAPPDLLGLRRIAQRCKKVVEFGCGATTLEMLAAGVNLHTFSLEVSNPAKAFGNIKFTECDLADMFFVKQIRDELKDAELLVIDADHSWSFAKFYHENYLRDFEGFVWIHDYFANAICGEQKYLERFVVGKTHEIVFRTDLPLYQLKEISDDIGYNLTHWSRSRAGMKRASLCSVLLKRKV